MSDADAPNDGIDPTLPEVVQQFLRSGAPLESIRLDAEGRWWHEGEPFENARLIALFSRSVERTPGGTWVLHIAPYTYPIEVEDTGHFVERLLWTGEQASLVLSTGEEVPLDVAGLRFAGTGRLYVPIAGGRFEARFKRAAYHDLLGCAEERNGEVLVCVGGVEKSLGSLDDAEDAPRP